MRSVAMPDDVVFVEDSPHCEWQTAEVRSPLITTRSLLQSDWNALSTVRRSAGNHSPRIATGLQNCMCPPRIHCALQRWSMDLLDRRATARLRRAALFIVDSQVGK
ncbi:hypothetical protein Bxe_A1723 [Paraburkholderia xenovorans LB400]|uniref:Uncharacterized protein n=1 Tax=Paraburkholderia xenovorans (strain LB400) TaxID=266265 RepID=Q13XF6_PARXL|nr:hypothetical protein Bxe_A1723 [Paraburkholderia xenovorans LB400]